MFRADVLSALCACAPVAYGLSSRKWILGGIFSEIPLGFLFEMKLRNPI